MGSSFFAVERRGMPERIVCSCGAVHAAGQESNHQRGRQHREWLDRAAIADPERREPPTPPEPHVLRGEPAPEQSEYERSLAAALAQAEPDLDAREISPEQAAERAAARSAGGDAPQIDDAAAETYDREIPDPMRNAVVREAPPPWPEAHVPAGFAPNGPPLPKDDPARNALAVGVEPAPLTRGQREARAKSFEVQPSPIEMALGVNPGYTRPDQFFDWMPKDPNGFRFLFTRYYPQARVLEDRIFSLTDRDRHDVAAKAKALAAHNAANPNEKIGYIVLLASTIRPDPEAIERALAGEIVTDVQAPHRYETERIEPGRVIDVSPGLGEMAAIMTGGPPSAPPAPVAVAGLPNA